MHRSVVFVALGLVGAPAPGGWAGADPPGAHRVPDGFVIEQVAGPPQVVFPMFAALDDAGRLFVAESSGLDLYAEISAQTRKCRVRLLEDPDGDGRFDLARVFADNLVFPMGLAWREGRLYVADPPDLVAFEDADGDGRAEKRTVILSGFGHRDNGSLHGLVFGPDGLLYMTMGNPDGYRLAQGDGSVLAGTNGALLRSGPDGSHPQVVARGFVNLVEVAFLPQGQIVGTVNWFRRPVGGLRDALVHLVEGGLYPLNEYTDETHQPVTGDPLPAASMFPAVALSGLVRYRGTAFPAEMQGSLFSAQHNARAVGRHLLEPEGSTLWSRDADFVTSDDPDFHPSDVLEAGDGSLLVIDTGGWYVQHCPTGRIRDSRAPGGIYRVRYAAAEPVADPYGSAIPWSRASIDELAALLGDPRPVVRDRAERLLSRQGAKAVPTLAAALASPEAKVARPHAVWALAAIDHTAALRPLGGALAGSDPDLAALAARALASRRDPTVAPRLCRLLAHEAPPVRMAAAEALAHCGDARCLPALWQALGHEPDRFLEHALIHAAYRLAGALDLEAALLHDHPRVRKAALLLLDQPPHNRLTSGQLVACLATADAGLGSAAIAVLKRHPEWSRQAIDLVGGWLGEPTLSADQRSQLPALILAFQSDGTVVELVAAALADRDEKAPVPPDRLVLLLDTVAQCSLAELPRSWTEALARAAGHPAAEVRAAAVRSIAVLQVPALDEELARLAQDAAEPAELRMDALRAVIRRRPRLSGPAFELLIGQLDADVAAPQRLAAAEVAAQSQLADDEVKRLLAQVAGDPLVSPGLLLPLLERSLGGGAAGHVVEYLTASVGVGWRPRAEDLGRLVDRFPPSHEPQAAAIAESVRASDSQLEARLAQYRPLLEGGDPRLGRQVFFGNQAACSACHPVGDEGGHVGPDLTKIGAVRAGRDLLESIVLPSSTFAQGYDTYAVVMTDGRIAQGLITRQSAEVLVLGDASGKELRLPKRDIQEMHRLTTSIMPDGLASKLSRDELGGLLAFLQGLK